MDYSRICGAGRRAKYSLEKKEHAFMSETEQEQQRSDEISLPVDPPPPTFLKITGPLPGGRQLTHPLDVKIAYDDGEVVVSEPRFHIHAVDPTIAQALAELRRLLSEELDELTADEEELGPRLKAELQYLRDLI